MTPNPQPPLIGLALAGGASRRMGRNKAQLEWRAGSTLLEWTIERLHHATGRAPLVACGRVVNRDGPQQFSNGPSDGTASAAPGARPIQVDDGPARGPLAGLLGAQTVAPERALLVLACDLPLITSATIEALVRQAQDSTDDAVVAWGPDRWQPLFGLYRPGALELLRQLAARGEHALYPALRSGALKTARFCGTWPLDESMQGAWHRQLLNVNTPQDLAHARRASEV